MPYELLSSSLKITLIQGLSILGRFPEAMKLTDETIRSVGVNGDACYAPELLRVKGVLLLSAPEPDRNTAERCLVNPLNLAGIRALAPGNCGLRSTSRRCGLIKSKSRARGAFCSLCSKRLSKVRTQKT